MYSSSSILTLRAKGSFYHHHQHHHCCSGDRAAGRGGRCGHCFLLGTAHPSCEAAGFCARSIFPSPRLLYGYWLRQSALIRRAPCRIAISNGGWAAAVRCRRLSAAWDRDLWPDGECGRWSKCSIRRVACGVGEPDGAVHDILGLLAQVEECVGDTDGAAEEACALEKFGFKSHGGKQRRFCGKDSDSSREDDNAARASEFSSSYQSASSSSISGDSSRKFFGRRDRDESSGGYSQNAEMAEREVRESWKREDDRWSRRRCRASDSVAGLESDSKKREWRSRERKHDTSSLVGSVHQFREHHVQKDQCVDGQKEFKEELEKVSKASHVQERSATERNLGSEKTLYLTKEETLAVNLLEEVRRQKNEIEQLRNDYQNLLSTMQVYKFNDTNASASSNVSNTRVKDLGETSTLPMVLLDEVQRQRSEIEQLNENYQKLMRAYKMQQESMIRESSSMESSRTTLENRVESSFSAANLVEKEAVECCDMEKQTIHDSRAVSQKLTKTNHSEKGHRELKTSGIHESDSGRNSNYKNGLGTISEERKKKAISAVNLVEGVREHHTNIAQGQHSISHADLRTSAQKLTERTDIHRNSIETASRSQRHYVTRVGDQKEHAISSVNRIEEREEQASVDAQVSQSNDSIASSQKLTDIVEFHKNDKTGASRTQDHVETMVKGHGENSTSVQHLVQLAREKRVQIDQQVIEKINVGKDTRHHIDISKEFKGETDNASAVFGDHEKNSASDLNLGYEVQYPKNEDGKRVTQQFRLSSDSQQRAPQAHFFEGGPVNVSELQMSSSTGTNTGDDYSSLLLVQEAKEKKKSNLVEETSGASSGTSEWFYSPGHVQSHELDYHTKSDGLYPVRDDVLESARRLDKSSSHYVGEFVDQLQQKILASEETDTTSYNSPETQMEASHSSPLQKPKATVECENEMCKEEGTWRDSSKSEVAGPSDEIWDVRAGDPQKPSTTEEPENSSSVRILGTTSAPASTGGTVIKRSSKSLWSYIAEIIRMGWRTRTSSQKPMLKSGTRSPSGESVSSDAWYSGHEPEDDREENVKNGRKVTKKDSIGGSYGFNGSPPASRQENLVPVDGGNGIEGIPSAIETASQSALLGSTSVSTYEGGTEIDRVHTSEVSFIKSQAEQIVEGIPEVDGTEGKDAELKRRKLQRNKQVLREEFEEWEDAYKLETEQRKTDEIFMREALLEAKKAADMWEVPVGAVLVQDGKIIARGCNLVEDLRDSTAHAEMICIREASGHLRTWRLAGTTLYVTVEPCAMCAGAILQARIDAIVWGAPNKLLGADGSWVRLFPRRDEGKHGLDQSKQEVGPVHPFHPKILIRRGVLATECADAMQQFFQLRRKKKKPEPTPPSRLPINYPAKLLTKMHNMFCMMACI